MPTITFDETAVETVIEAFGWTVNNAGCIVHSEPTWPNEPGDPVTAFDGNPIKRDEFGGVIKHPDTGNPVPIHDENTDYTHFRESQSTTNDGP